MDADTMEFRIIPARAGFTRSSRSPPTRASDHPRSRGVYVSAILIRPRTWGSSPLARGLPAGETDKIPAIRIIPARAGFTRRPRSWRPSRRDHPRSRGVYEPGGLRTRALDGSSPLARGLRDRTGRHPHPIGIIPARAGFTRWGGACSPARAGSSPLARGLHGEEMYDYGPDRIIPARAGFTRRGGRSGPAPADHPRSRGVYQVA